MLEKTITIQNHSFTGVSSLPPTESVPKRRDQYSFEAWLFVNHLALQMLYAVIGALAEKELTDRYSFEDVMAFLKHVRANRIDGEWRLTKITRHAAKLCQELGIEMEEPTNLRVSLK